MTFTDTISDVRTTQSDINRTQGRIQGLQDQYAEQLREIESATRHATERFSLYEEKLEDLDQLNTLVTATVNSVNEQNDYLARVAANSGTPSILEVHYSLDLGYALLQGENFGAQQQSRSVGVRVEGQTLPEAFPVVDPTSWSQTEVLVPLSSLLISRLEAQNSGRFLVRPGPGGRRVPVLNSGVIAHQRGDLVVIRERLLRDNLTHATPPPNLDALSGWNVVIGRSLQFAILDSEGMTISGWR